MFVVVYPLLHFRSFSQKNERHIWGNKQFRKNMNRLKIVVKPKQSTMRALRAKQMKWRVFKRHSGEKQTSEMKRRKNGSRTMNDANLTIRLMHKVIFREFPTQKRMCDNQIKNWTSIYTKAECARRCLASLFGFCSVYNNKNHFISVSTYNFACHRYKNKYTHFIGISKMLVLWKHEQQQHGWWMYSLFSSLTLFCWCVHLCLVFYAVISQQYKFSWRFLHHRVMWFHEMI